MSIYLNKPTNYQNEVAKPTELTLVPVKEKATTKIERIYAQFKKNPEITTEERAFLESVDLKRLPRRYEQLVNTVLRHKSQKQSLNISEKDLFQACVTCIENEEYDNLKLLLDTAQRYGMAITNSDGTTLLTHAFMADDARAQSLIQSAGTTHHFSFKLDEKHWTNALSLVLGEQKSTHLIKPIRGSTLPFTCNITYQLWNTFTEFVLNEKTEWVSKKLVSKKSLETIGSCILDMLSPNLESKVSRIQQGLPVIIPISDGEHGMKLVFVKQHVFYCNRGKQYQGQTKNIELYQCDTSKLTKKHLYTLETTLSSKKANHFIYGTLKKELECTQPENFCAALAKFKGQSDQKSGNCNYASIKSAIFTLLISKHSKSLTPEKLEDLYKIYKACTAHFRITMTAKFIDWKKETQSINLL